MGCRRRRRWTSGSRPRQAEVDAREAERASKARAFDALNLGIGLFIHASLSLLVGFIYAALLPMLPGRVVLWGGVVAPCLWSAVAWTSLETLSPEMAEHVQWGWWVASQIAYGLAAGLVIERAERIETLQTWPLAVRAGIEAGGGDEP